MFSIRLRKIRRGRQRGFVLTDFILAFFFFAMLGFSMYQLASDAGSDQEIEEAVRELSTIQRSTQSLYGATRDYSSLTPSVLINADKIPQKNVGGSNTLRNTFGGEINVSGGVGSYTIEFEEVTAEACSELATKDYGQSVEEMTFNGGTTYVRDAGELPVDPGSVAGDGICPDGGATIAWTFRG